MTVVKTLTKEQLTRFGELFGPPPVLTTESSEHYEAIWNLLLECLAPQNFLEMMLIKQVQAETWKWLRLNRHQSLAIECRFRQSLKFQIERRNEQKLSREALTRERAEKTGRPITDFAKLLDLEDVVMSVVSDVDELRKRSATETEHNEALEEGIVFHEQLDQLINATMARRNNALETLEVYREGLGQYWRRISGRDRRRGGQPEPPPQQVEAPAIVPAEGASQ